MRMWGPAQAVDEAPRPPALPPEPPTVSSAWSSLGESGRCPAGPWGGKGGPLPQGSMRSAFSVLTGWPGEGQQRVCPVGLLCCPHRLQAPPALCRCICRNQSLTEDRVLAFAGSRTALQQVAPSYYLPLAFGPCGRSLGPRAGSLGTEGEQALPGVCPDALVLELPLPPAPQPPFLSHVWPSSPVSVRRSWALGTLRSWNSPSIHSSRGCVCALLPPLTFTSASAGPSSPLLTPRPPQGAVPVPSAGQDLPGGSHHLDLPSDM